MFHRSLVLSYVLCIMYYVFLWSRRYIFWYFITCDSALIFIFVIHHSEPDHVTLIVGQAMRSGIAIIGFHRKVVACSCYKKFIFISYLNYHIVLSLWNRLLSKTSQKSRSSMFFSHFFDQFSPFFMALKNYEDTWGPQWRWIKTYLYMILFHIYHDFLTDFHLIFLHDMANLGQKHCLVKPKNFFEQKIFVVGIEAQLLYCSRTFDTQLLLIIQLKVFVKTISCVPSFM